MICVEIINHLNGTVGYRGQVELKGHSVQSAFFKNRNDAEDWAKKTETDIITRDLILELKG